MWRTWSTCVSLRFLIFARVYHFSFVRHILKEPEVHYSDDSQRSWCELHPDFIQLIGMPLCPSSRAEQLLEPPSSSLTNDSKFQVASQDSLEKHIQKQAVFILENLFCPSFVYSQNTWKSRVPCHIVLAGPSPSEPHLPCPGYPRAHIFAAYFRFGLLQMPRVPEAVPTPHSNHVIATSNHSIGVLTGILVPEVQIV